MNLKGIAVFLFCLLRSDAKDVLVENIFVALIWKQYKGIIWTGYGR
jgi:hypothetical protein